MRMTLRDWMTYEFPALQLIINASPVDGSDFMSHHPIGISVFAAPWLPEAPAALHKKRTEFINKTNLCSAMFQPGGKKRDNPHRVEWIKYIDENPDWFQFIRPRYWDKSRGRISAESYMKQLASDKFTLSPRGHGMDCHRNYEAILMGCVPIISPLDDAMQTKYHGLPVLFVHGPEYMPTSAALANTWEQMLSTEYDFSPMLRSYWQRKRPDVDIVAQMKYWCKRYNVYDRLARYF